MALHVSIQSIVHIPTLLLLILAHPVAQAHGSQMMDHQVAMDICSPDQSLAVLAW